MGCKEPHGLRTKAPVTMSGGEPICIWEFNGNIEAPTFTPSLRYKRSKNDGSGRGPACHFNVTKGKVQYHNDCEHELKDSTIDMPKIADYLPPDYFI